MDWHELTRGTMSNGYIPTTVRLRLICIFQFVLLLKKISGRVQRPGRKRNVRQLVP